MVNTDLAISLTLRLRGRYTVTCNGNNAIFSLYSITLEDLALFQQWQNPIAEAKQ